MSLWIFSSNLLSSPLSSRWVRRRLTIYCTGALTSTSSCFCEVLKILYASESFCKDRMMSSWWLCLRFIARSLNERISFGYRSNSFLQFTLDSTSKLTSVVGIAVESCTPRNKSRSPKYDPSTYWLNPLRIGACIRLLARLYHNLIRPLRMKYISFAFSSWLKMMSSVRTLNGLNIGRIFQRNEMSLSRKKMIFLMISPCVCVIISVLIDDGRSFSNESWYSELSEFRLFASMNFFTFCLVSSGRPTLWENSWRFVKYAWVFDSDTSRLEMIEVRLLTVIE
mmetsp:Transcript_13150/g.15219  ORF Transcript_13150/g.15219 Transcript_13150/m.15219 type:complete len:281 (-) Transcript_13150:1487-2329(-)